MEQLKLASLHNSSKLTKLIWLTLLLLLVLALHFLIYRVKPEEKTPVERLRSIERAKEVLKNSLIYDMVVDVDKNRKKLENEAIVGSILYDLKHINEKLFSTSIL